MKIELKEITIKEVSEGYLNDEEEGVTGFKGKLNIRPKYQREFVYKDKQKNSVIETIRKDFPLNVMYWVKSEDGTYEVMDGQQRTISLCEYIAGNFSFNFQFFENLTDDEKKQILNYKLMIYFCEGTDKEKLDWFEIINIAGEKLTDQELKNAIYTGTWLTDAKRHFSKTGCPAYNLAKEYMKGVPIRQDYLETAISWIKAVFPNYRREMKGIDFGILYNEFKDEEFDSKEIEKEIVELMQDEDVSKKSGIYPYILTRNEKYLSIRSFTDKQKRESYERQEGICPKCTEHFEIDEMEADHITPWHEGGKTTAENCQMLCKHDNRIKSGK